MPAVEKTKKQPKKAGQATWFSRHAYLLVIAAFTFLLYANMLGNGYNLDDELVTINHRLTSQGISAIPEIFTSPYYQDNMGYAYEYRPMALTSFAIEHQFFGESPFMGHVISLLLYIGLCILLYKFLLQLGGVVTPPLALFITLLFSAFTAHTEVVCSIKNRDELLGLIFSLLAARYALLAARSDKWWLVLAVPFFYLLAILSKITFLQFSLLIPLLLILFEKKGFVYILLLTAALGGLTYGFLDVNPARYKMCYLVGLLGAVMILYGVVNLRLSNIKTVLASLQTFKSDNPTTDANKENSFKQWFASFSQLELIGFIIAALVIAIDWFFVKNTWLIVPYLSGIVGFSVLLEYRQSKYWGWKAGVLLFATLLSVEVITAPYTLWRHDFIFYRLFTFCLIFQFYYGPSQWRLTSLGLAIFIISLAPAGEILVVVTYLVAIFIMKYYTHHRWTKIVLAVLGVVLIIGNVLAIVTGYFPDLIEVVVFIFYYSIVYRPESIRHWRKAIVAMMGVYILSLLVTFLPQFSTYNLNRVIIQVNTDNDALNVVNTVVKQKTDRPLQYIEFPMPPHPSVSIKAGTALVTLQHYLQKTILPYPLSLYYGYAYIVPVEFNQPSALFSLAVHLALLLVALVFLRYHPFIAFALFIYLATVVIYSGMFMPVPGIVADRYMLVSSLGWCMLLGYGLFYVIERYLAKKTITDWASVSTPARILLLFPLVIYSGLTFARNFDWKDHLTLMRKDVQYVTNSAQAHNLLALNIMKSTTEVQKTQAELDALRQEALSHFKQSFAIYPNTFNVAYDIGRVYSAMNNPDSMMVYFQKAADLDPDHQLPELSYTLAVYHQETKKYDYAIIQLQKLLKLQNTNLEAYSRLSYIHFTLGQYDQALATNRTAAFNLPTRPEPFINIAYTFQGMKNLDSMKYYFNLAEQRFPGHPVVLQAKRNLNNQ
jgi:tetratricopeptide (TPR) repeat protein